MIKMLLLELKLIEYTLLGLHIKNSHVSSLITTNLKAKMA